MSYIVIKVKPEHSELGIREIVGIYHDPYDKGVKAIIDFWIEPEFRHEVYGYKYKK